ncbi:hypothetical protein JCM10207_001925 [Rhodosporidiobolus poonsookiae]
MARTRSRTPSAPPPSYFSPRHAAALLLVAAGSAAAQSTSPSSLPKIDFDAMGTVAVVGSFAGLSLYDAANPPTTYDSRAATLVGRTSDGDLRNLGATDVGGAINAVCQRSDGSVYVGGNFTSIGGVEASNIASYDPTGKAFAALGGGLQGEVRALSCNGSTVYVGGDFSAPDGVSAGENVAGWSVADQSWSALPFYGLNGAVESIYPSEDGRSLFFGGSFSTLFSNSTGGTTTSSSSTDPSQIASLGSSLTPISLNASDYWASPTTYISGFGRPQYIFCPKHADGIGASWLLVDGQNGFFIARMYRQLNVRGIRLGNTFYGGRGTKTFSVVSIPTNEVLTLSYNSDPSDITSELVTCSDACPLAHNESLPYQDFLFPEGTTLTGVQVNINEWYGPGGGLHLFQLLSDGAYAYAVESNNNSPCTEGLGASTQANVSTTGLWTTSNVTTATAGTTQDVLIASVAGGTDPSDAPTVTWQPYVSQPGEYAVYFVTPGCTAEGTCSRRTSVSVTATPSGGSASTTTVDQTAGDTQSTLIYNGTLSAGADALSVTMTLADGGAPSSGTTYELVADLINLVAASTSASLRLERGYGLFEFPLVDTGAFGDAVPTAQAAGVNASATLTNATGVDALAFSLNQGAVVHALVSVGSGDQTRLFVGGNLTYSQNGQTSVGVVSYTSDGVVVTPNGGLDGIITSLVELDGALYASGAFVASADGSVTDLGGIARWNYTSASASWEALGDVPSTLARRIWQLGVVTGASAESASNGQSGASVIAVGEGGSGLAFYAPTSGAWNDTAAGFFLGNLSAVGTALDRSSTNATTYLAGNVVAAVKNAAPGGAVLSSGKSGVPQLSSFGFGFNSTSSSSSSSASSSSGSSSSSTSARVRRAELATSPATIRRGLSRVILEPRAASTSVNLTLPAPIQAVAASASSASTASTNQVLAGAFWKNGSTDLMLLGGAFVSSSTNGSATVQNLGAYDTDADELRALPGLEVSGAVTALLVVEDTLWVGGNFSSAERQGLATYDLKGETSDNSQPALTGYSGTNATVNIIAQRPGYDEQILVAGAFAQAGSLPCESVCLWDTKKLQWSNLAVGLQGVVGSIDFAGDKSQYLLAAGNFILDSETRYIAQWNFKNSSWTGLGAPTDLPGPATAVSSDNHNADKIFVAGSSLSGTPYLHYWNGSTWSDVNNNTLETGSGVQSLAFVPLQSNHAKNDVLESNRMLMVSGDLTINDTSVASALYDGQTWYPYLLATSSTGSAGIVSQLFYSITDFSLSGRSHLSTGIVILISIAIALGVVFLLVLIGLLIALARRKDEPQYPPPGAKRSMDGTATETSSVNGAPLHRPTSLLQTVGAATAVLLDPKGEKGAAAGRDVDHDSIAGPLSFDGVGVGSYGSEYGDDEQPSTALARYSFHAEHPGELTISANENLTVLESSDPNWWMVANHSGQRGLVPNAYLC